MALRCLTRLKINQQILSKISLPLSCIEYRNFSNVDAQKLLLHPAKNWNQFNVIRTRYDGKSGKSSTDENVDENADDEYADDPQEKKNIVKYSMQSMRADLIMKQVLGIARNKIEVAFYEGKIRVNGKKINKKSHSVQVGDEIDLIKGESPNNPDHLVISRIEILSAIPKEESIAVTMKRFKQMLVDRYKDH